jgi:hypothetical protein
MTDSRSPQDVASGVLRITVGGVEKIVPTLPIRATREWQAAIADRPGRFTPGDPDDWTQAEAADFTALTLDVILDVVTAYDRTNALGGREWLEEHADPAQLYAAASLMAEVAFPFAENTRLLLAALVARTVVGSDRPSSTNGPSAIGDLRRRPSRQRSTRAS